MVFLGPRANVELAQKFHFVPLASHAALPIIGITSSRRTGGHCLGTFITGDIFSCPSSNYSLSYLPNFTLFFMYIVNTELWRWAGTPGPFLGNGSVNTFPQQQTRKQL
jgi:hypothetical protein